jgi:hypothetical protein
MASTVFASAPSPAVGPASLVATAARRLVNAIASSRIDAAERELRRHTVVIGETGLVHGEFRAISLDKADLLPFNA